MSSKLGAAQWDQREADSRVPEDMEHAPMEAEEVQVPEKLEALLVREASELDRGRERGYNDLL